MTLELLTFLGLFVLGFFIYFLLQNQSNKNSDKFVDSLSSQLAREQAELTAQAFKQIAEIGQNQSQLSNQNLSQNLLKLEQRFGSLQKDLVISQTQALEKTNLKFEQQSSYQQQEFTKIRQNNLEALQKIQEVLSNKLSNCINDLNQVNQKNFELLAKANQDKLAEIQGEIETKLNQNLKHNLESFEKVQKRLVEMESTAQKMIDSASNTTNSVQKLNQIFSHTNSNALGDFGEKYLESLLRESLSGQVWYRQKSLQGGGTIDFLITIGGKKIGIDSKLPATKYKYILEAPTIKDRKIAQREFLQTVVKMGEDISKKYLKTNYLDQLLLYLPSDSMYIEVVNDQKALESLREHKVIPVSPATIYPIITTVQTYELRLKINKNAENIIQGLSQVKKNITSFRGEFRKLGDKLRGAQQNYNSADRNLDMVENTTLSLLTNSDQKESLQDTAKSVITGVP